MQTAYIDRIVMCRMLGWARYVCVVRELLMYIAICWLPTAWNTVTWEI
jgi:hypothetical protein